MGKRAGGAEEERHIDIERERGRVKVRERDWEREEGIWR